MIKVTYTVQQLDRHTQVVDSDGMRHPVYIWDCGHKHRTLRGAYRCLRTLDGFTRSIDSSIYASDGSDVETDWIEHEEYGAKHLQ